jgi:pimeloyl-ACP methyl ester carboxylesterase
MHLLLLPGMDGTGQLFKPLLRVLPPSLPAVVVSYPPDRPCGYADLLPLVEAAVPAGEEFIVLGESFSGPLALLLAARRPSGLRGVILCASFAHSPLPRFARWFRGLIRPLWFRATPTSLVGRVLLGRYRTPSLMHMVQQTLAVVTPAVLAARVRAILSVDVGREIQACPVPLLYLSATEDRLVSPRSLARIRRLYPAVEQVTLAGPHLLLQAAPEQAASAIQRFAASCAEPARA